MRWEDMSKISAAAKKHRDAAKVTEDANKKMQDFLKEEGMLALMSRRRELEISIQDATREEKVAAEELLNVMKKLEG